MLRRLFFDIECSKAIALTFSAGRDCYINPDDIIQYPAIICICYKWEGQDKVYSLQWDKNKNDKSLLEKFVKIAEQADELVGHNGDNFDIKYIRTRCLFHRISMMPEFTTLDTYKAAKAGFRFMSNKLDFIAKYIGSGGKTHTGNDLWNDITLKNSPAARKIMVDYCKNDVLELEKVYLAMKPYTKAKLRISQNKEHCPECDSLNVKVRSYKISIGGNKFAHVQCHDCGKYFKVPEKVWRKIEE